MGRTGVIKVVAVSELNSFLHRKKKLQRFYPRKAWHKHWEDLFFLIAIKVKIQAFIWQSQNRKEELGTTFKPLGSNFLWLFRISPADLPVPAGSSDLEPFPEDQGCREGTLGGDKEVTALCQQPLDGATGPGTSSSRSAAPGLLLGSPFGQTPLELICANYYLCKL